MKSSLRLIFSFFLLYSTEIFSQSNVDFEATTPGAYTTSNAVSGWTVGSQSLMQSSCNTITWTPGSPEFSIVSTPLVSASPISAVLPVIPSSPLGGSHIACLNSTTANNSATKLSRSFWVTSANSLFQYAFAGAWESCQSLCCEAPGFKVQVKDQSGQLLSCLTESLSSSIGCNTSGSTYSVTSSGVFWTSWQMRTIDLSSFTGSSVTIEIISHDCVYSSHYGTLYVDAVSLPAPSNVNFCPGSNQAILSGPAGFATYSWTAPPGTFLSPSQATQSSVAIMNPIPGAVYSLNLTSGAGCSFITTYTIAATQVSISTVLSNPSCSGGSVGSATVFTSGSSAGYTYTWLNAANAVAGTSASVAGLAPGIYTVNVTAGGSSSATCGYASTTISIGTSAQPPVYLLRSFCGSEAYLSYPGGNNYQWYHNGIAIGSGGTAPSYTVIPAVNMDNYLLGYDNPNGCRDSLAITLVNVSPGNITITNSPACAGANNGTMSLTLNAAQGAPSGLNAFYISSTGTTSPYTASLDPTSANIYTASGLSAGTYTVNAFDGSCKYSGNFSVAPVVFDFSVTPSSATLCPGNGITLAVSQNTPASPGQYTYSWSPSSNMSGSTSAVTLLTSFPMTPGTTSVIVYSVAVTPSIANCPLIRTATVTFVNPLTPTITSIPQLCAESSTYAIVTNPAGGTFNHFAISPGGILTPSLASPGLNTFIYANSVGTCVASASGSFFINTLTMSVSNNYNIACGQTITLSASGADTYQWSTSATSSSIVVMPLHTSTFSVIGTNTTSTCTKTETLQVSVTSTLSLLVSGNFSICNGGSALLTVSGANTYTWSNNSTNPSVQLSPASTTQYSVTGIDAVGCENSKTLTVYVSDCTGISSPGSHGKINVYPNPANEKLFIETPWAVKISLCDGLGRILVSKDIQPISTYIDLKDYPDGMYFLSIFSDSTSEVIKVVKTN